MLTLRFASDARPPDPSSGRLVNTWHDDTGGEFARAFVGPSTRWIDWTGLGTFTFAPGTRTVWAVPADGVSRHLMRGTFQRSVQPVILQALGWQALHAGAASTPDGVLVLCGRGGSGKSTLGHALGRAGCPQIADDAVVFSCTADGLVVHPLPFHSQLRPASLAYFDARDGRPRDAASGSATAAPQPMRCVFVVHQDPAGDRNPSIRRLTAVEAFTAILSHAHCFDEADAAHAREMIDAYMMLADRIPVFHLSYRPDFASLDALVTAVLDTAASEGTGAVPPATVWKPS